MYGSVLAFDSCLNYGIRGTFAEFEDNENVAGTVRESNFVAENAAACPQRSLRPYGLVVTSYEDITSSDAGPSGLRKFCIRDHTAQFFVGMCGMGITVIYLCIELSLATMMR